MKMEDKRTLLAVLLCLVAVMLYSQLFFAPQSRQPAARDTLATLDEGDRPSGPSLVQPGAAPARSLEAHPTLEEVRSYPVLTVETDKAIIQITLLGGRILSYRLKDHRFKLADAQMLDMVSVSPDWPLPLGLLTASYTDDRVLYSVDKSSQEGLEGESKIRVRDGQELILELSGQYPTGSLVYKTFKINGGSNLFSLSSRLQEPAPEQGRLWIEWSHFLPASMIVPAGGWGGGPGQRFSRLGDNNKVIVTAANEVEDGIQSEEATRWISFQDQYFTATLIPVVSGRNTQFGRQADTFISRVGGSATEANLKAFVGAKEYAELQALGYALERNVNLGIFSFIAHPLLWLVRFFNSFLNNFGLSIILLTLFIKFLFLPLTRVSFDSMKKMQDMQPEMKALRERVKDPTQLNQEMMALYKRKGVNPLGGCFPILIQIPVFLGLFNALNNAIELRHAPFALWINDLSAPERLDFFGIGIPVMVLLMGLSMFVQQWTTPTAMDPMQKKIFMAMPVVFTIVFIIFPFPAGLVLYWLVNNLISIVQQIFLRRDVKGGPTRATVVASLAIFACGYALTLL